jgi:pyridoxal phosphate enzyme (YggS family)
MTVSQHIHELRKHVPQAVTLVAVSKTKPDALISEAYEAGQRDFGENYVQELAEKQARLPADIRWHFIGHLQSNKVKYIAPFVHLIHGVDSLRLLREIDKQGLKHGRIIDCLLQVYIAREETKFGLSFEECRELLGSDELTTLKHIRIRGFMGMASHTSDEAVIRREFAALRTFNEALSSNPAGQGNFQPGILSFGMSGDWKIALEEGSTMLRIGSLIFGDRSYSS